MCCSIVRYKRSDFFALIAVPHDAPGMVAMGDFHEQTKSFQISILKLACIVQVTDLLLCFDAPLLLSFDAHGVASIS